MGRRRRTDWVFLSHTGIDKPFARRLATDLEALGLSVWFDEWELRVGDSLTARIEQAIQASRWMIVVLSREALQSEWVLTELRSGLTREIRGRTVFILPVLYKAVSLPLFLQDKFYADFTSSYEHGLAVLKDRLLRSYEHVGGPWLQVHGPTFLVDKADGGQPLPEELLFELAGHDLRTMLSLATSLAAPIRGARARMADVALTKSSSPGGLWFGRSGRLILRDEGNRVSGDYDWHGLSLAGRIRGTRTADIITFEWNWSRSSERGRGLFWCTIPNVLFGGWWMDYEDVIETDILAGRRSLPNRWEFVNLGGLKITSPKDL